MKSPNLKLFFALIYLIIFNFLFVQTNQNYNNKQEELLSDSEEPFVYLKDAFKDKLTIGSMTAFTELNKDENFVKNHFDILSPK